MKVVELLKLGGEVLKLMSRNDVLRDDWRFVPMYEEFQEMRSKGVKYRECIRMLAEESATLGKYIDGSTMFKAVHDLAVDKLTDKDGVFSVRKYFGV